MSKKKRITKTKHHSLSYEDDIPLGKLIKIARHSKDPNSYDSLSKPSTEQCEFCENVSRNRYSSIIHNIRHIIIPLINQTVYQCEMCLFYFKSMEDLAQHQYKKHSLIDLVTHTDLVKEGFNDPEDKDYESDFITIVKDDSRKFKHIDDSNVEFKTKKNIDTLKEDSVKEGSTEKIINTCKENSVKEGSSLKSRLMFEEDITVSNCDKILNDLTVSCQVNIELFPPVWDVDYPKSVHYEQLVRPGVYKCRKCMAMFPSRYDMIIHETQHVVIKNSQVVFCNICNKYILGDNKILKHHKLSHSNLVESQKCVDITRKHNGGNVERQNGVDYMKIKTLTLCTVCFSFYKNNSFVNYYLIDKLQEIDKRFTCIRCGCKFYDINLVRQVFKRNKKMSNEERLKIISRRFKKMKLYLVVLFHTYFRLQ